MADTPPPLSSNQRGIFLTVDDIERLARAYESSFTGAAAPEEEEEEVTEEVRKPKPKPKPEPQPGCGYIVCGNGRAA